MRVAANCALAMCALAPLAQCGGQLAPGSDGGSTIQEHLYILDEGSGSILQYALPLKSGANPTKTISYPTFLPLDIAEDAVGTVAVGDSDGAAIFSPPFGSTNGPTVSFSFGSGVGGQLAFSVTGDLFSGGGQAIIQVSAPFTPSSTGVQLDFDKPFLNQAYGVAFDQQQNLLVGNIIQETPVMSNVLEFPPPYTGAPTVSASISDVAYDHLVVIEDIVFALEGAQVDGFALPITAGSTPAFSIATPGDGAFAVGKDGAGNLYVAAFRLGVGGYDILAFTPPFSNASVPVTVLTLSGATVRGIAAGL